MPPSHARYVLRLCSGAAPDEALAKGEGVSAAYFYDLLASSIALYVRPENTVLEVNPLGDHFRRRFGNYSAAMLEEALTATQRHREEDSGSYSSVSPCLRENESRQICANSGDGSEKALEAQYVIMDGTVHYERDIHALLSALHGRLNPETRVVLTYYNTLWKPLLHLASKLGLRRRAPEENWIAHEDLVNFALLAGFEVIRRDPKILCPVRIPLLADFINRYLAPLPFFNLFSIVNLAVLRPVKPPPPEPRPSVSIVVPARNESGNIENILARCPLMGPKDELIFVEGNSTDDTWDRICQARESYRGPHRLVIAKQEGKGKGDAVRKGFALATNEILMILDADLTVPPEDLPKFYDAIVQNKGEFINGSRLVYPMEKQAMRFFNILGNKFFAAAFSFVLGQRFKDTLCGTKVLTRRNYERIAAARNYFGEFDPFGDFDLIFGAARLGLKIMDVPIRYRERTYGETNIQRWKHGMLLLCMLIFAARRMKFLPNLCRPNLDHSIFAKPNKTMDQRLQNEIEHGRYLLEHGAGEVWNWEGPAGKQRWARRVKMLTSHLTAGMSVLELGCGTGYFSRELAGTGAAITAIDISEELLNDARRNVAAANVTFKVENAYSMSFPDGSFDSVVGSSVLHHLEIERAIAECFRVLKPGGAIVFTEPNMMNPQIAVQKNVPAIKRRLGDSPDETAFFRWPLRRSLERAGFREVRIVPFDFLHPRVPEGAIPAVRALGEFLEKLPLLREIAGSLYIRATK